MKRLLLILLLTAPCFADLRIDKIIVLETAPKSEQAHIQVDVVNDGPRPETLDRLTLEVRDKGSQQWTFLRAWDNDRVLQPGESVSLQLLDQSGPEVAQIMRDRAFEMRVIIEALQDWVAEDDEV